MRKPSTILAVLGLVGMSVLLGACQSTQDKAKKLQAEAAKTAEAQVNLTIPKPDKDIKVLDSTVLYDAKQQRLAVVVKLQNKSKETVLNAPILVDVRDASGKSVSKNDAPDLDNTLQHVPLIEAGKTMEWVNDQFFLTGNGTPKTAKVTVGPPPAPGPTGPLPQIVLTPPKIENDPSGLSATGQATNKSKIDQPGLPVYVIAHQGGKVVAAGRGLVKNLKAGKSYPYITFPIGNPSGGQLSVTAFPTTFG